MSSPARLRALRIAVLSLSLALGAACKQGQGERCQVNNDCDDGLVCATSGTCQMTVGVSQDAGTDATPSDAAATDADTTDAEVFDTSPVLPDAPTI